MLISQLNYRSGGCRNRFGKTSILVVKDWFGGGTENFFRRLPTSADWVSGPRFWAADHKWRATPRRRGWDFRVLYALPDVACLLPAAFKSGLQIRHLLYAQGTL